MITFKQTGKFEYQILCFKKKPLYICLLPNNTISKKFATVTSSIQAMSETMGKVFDDYFFYFINGYQKLDSEDQRYSYLKSNVNKTLQFSMVFVNVNNTNYAEFADDSQKTNNSVFFDSKDILKILKLSNALKIYSIVQNTLTGIAHEKYREIYHHFLTLLKADQLPSKLLELLKINLISARKNKFTDEDDILILEALNYVLYNGLISLDHKRNPIYFFIGIFKSYIKFGGKYKPDETIHYIDDMVESEKDTIIKQSSKLGTRVSNITLNQLYRISLSYLVNKYERHIKIETGNTKYPIFLKGIKYNSPFWDLILAPLLSNVTGITHEKLKMISPQLAAPISFYCGLKLNPIFSFQYRNLFRLAYLFPVNQIEVRNYRLKNVSHFIDASLQYPINELSRINGSRIFLARLVEDFIGWILSIDFHSSYTGHLINKISTDKIEIETINYIVRYFTCGVEGELKEFEKIVAKDFEALSFKDKFEKSNKTFRNKSIAASKMILNGKINLKSKLKEGVPDNPAEPIIDNPIAGGANKNGRSMKSKQVVKTTVPKKYMRAYQTCKDDADMLVGYLKWKPVAAEKYIEKFKQSYDKLPDNIKEMALNYINKNLSEIKKKIIQRDGSFVIGDILKYKISVKEGMIVKEDVTELG